MRIAKAKDGSEVVILDEPARPQSPAPASTTSEGDVVILPEAPAQARARELTAEIRKAQDERARLEERRRQLALAIEQRADDINQLGALVAGSAPELPRTDSRGQVVPGGRAYQLKQLHAQQTGASRRLEELDRELAALDRKIEGLCGEGQRLLIGPAAELEHLAATNVARATRAERLAAELGRMLREILADEEVMARLGGTQRAQLALGFSALRMRLAYAFSHAGVFEADPDATGERGPHSFFQIEQTDPTSAMRGLTLAEIFERHYAQVIAEVCRAR